MKESITDFVRVLELDSTNHSDWCLLAPLLIELGDADAYRKHRFEMLGKFTATTDLPTMERIANAGLLLPADGAELETAGKLADTAVTQGTTHGYLPFFQLADGLAQYRRGQFREAVATQQSVLAAKGFSPRDVHAYAVIAMAYHRRGQPTEARAALAKGTVLAATLPPKPGENDFGGDWKDVLIAKLLFQEAKTLLGEK